MGAVIPLSSEQEHDELTDVVDLIRHRHRLRRPVDVLIEAGLSQPTGYRRLRDPGSIELTELRSISGRFDIPLAVIVSGHQAAMRWMIDHPGPVGDGGAAAPSPDDRGPVSGESSSACTRYAEVIPILRRTS